jgi:hypothetical protein
LLHSAWVLPSSLITFGSVWDYHTEPNLLILKEMPIEVAVLMIVIFVVNGLGLLASLEKGDLVWIMIQSFCMGILIGLGAAALALGIPLV